MSQIFLRLHLLQHHRFHKEYKYPGPFNAILHGLGLLWVLRGIRRLENQLIPHYGIYCRQFLLQLRLLLPSLQVWQQQQPRP